MSTFSALTAVPISRRAAARLVFLAVLIVALATLGAPTLMAGAITAGWLYWLLRPELRALRDRLPGRGHRLRCVVLLDDRARASALAALLGRKSRELTGAIGAISAGSGLCVVDTLTDDRGRPLNALLLARSQVADGAHPVGWIAVRDRPNDEILADLARLPFRLAALPPNARYERPIEGGASTEIVAPPVPIAPTRLDESAPPMRTANDSSIAAVSTPAPTTGEQPSAEDSPRAARGIRARAWVTDPLAPRDEPPAPPPTRSVRAS